MNFYNKVKMNKLISSNDKLQSLQNSRLPRRQIHAYIKNFLTKLWIFLILLRILR